MLGEDRPAGFQTSHKGSLWSTIMMMTGSFDMMFKLETA